MENLLITGGSGLLATNWSYNLRKKYNVLSGLHKKFIKIKNIESTLISFTNSKKLKNFLINNKIKTIIHTASVTDLEKCQKYKKLAKKTNITFTQNLVDQCKVLDIRLIYISTDQLYDGHKVLYNEDDKCRPINYYAFTKYESEKYIKKNLQNYLIIRTNFFGQGTHYRKSFSDFIIQNIKNKNEISINDNVFYTPISIDLLIFYANKLLSKNATGTYNISSSERISKFDFAMKLVKIFGLDASYIKRKKSLSSAINLFRPKNMSLSNNKLKKFLKLKRIPSINDQIKNLKSKKKKIKFEKIIQYGEHFIDKSDINSVTNVLRSKSLTQGPQIEKFEKNIARYVGSKYAVAVSSCTAGLHISSIVAGINKSNKGMTSPITFVSTANAVTYCGGKVEFVDIDPKTANISIKEIKKKIKKDKKIKAIFPIHFGGYPCDMSKLRKYTLKKKIYLIEDAAHALGARYKSGEMVGSCRFSDMCVFSFHPVKQISAGEGGVVTTNDYNIYKRLLRLRSHGINKLDDEYEDLNSAYTLGFNNPWYFEMRELGFHYRITDFQCALANSQLNKIEKFLKKRRQLAKRYDEAFKNSDVIKPLLVDKDKLSALHIYIININFKKINLTKAELMYKLFDKGIGSQVHYIPVTEHPFYKKKKYKTKDFPHSYNYYKSCLTIPLFFSLKLKTQDYIIKVLLNIIKEHRIK